MPAPVTGQAQGAGLTTPVPLSTTPVQSSAFVIYAPQTNVAAVYVGAGGVTSTTGHQIDPGGQVTYSRSVQQSGPQRYELEPSDFYVLAQSGDKVTWLASP